MIYRDIEGVRGSSNSSEVPLNAVPSEEAASKSSLSLSFYSLTLFMVVYFLRPEDWIPGAAILPLAKITVIFSVVGFVVAGLRGDLTWPPREIGILALLFGQLCVAVLFSVWPGGSFDVVFGRFVKAVVMTSLISYAANTTPRLRRLLFVQAACVTAIAILAISYYKTGRMGLAVGGNFGNPNDLAASLAIAFPLSFGFLLQAPNILKKLAWLASMGILIYGILLTSSRSGFLMLVVALLVSLWSFGFQGRRWWLMLIPAIALAGFSVAGTPSGYLQRLSSIMDPSLDATGSSQERQQILIQSLKVTEQHPLVGIGPGMFPLISGKWLGTHNTYTQLSSEAGIPALLLFLWLLKRALSNISLVKRNAPTRSETAMLAGAIQASLVSFIVGACFGHLAYQFYPYFLIGFAAALSLVNNRSLATTEIVVTHTISPLPSRLTTVS